MRSLLQGSHGDDSLHYISENPPRLLVPPILLPYWPTVLYSNQSDTFSQNDISQHLCIRTYTYKSQHFFVGSAPFQAGYLNTLILIFRDFFFVLPVKAGFAECRRSKLLLLCRLTSAQVDTETDGR